MNKKFKGIKKKKAKLIFKMDQNFKLKKEKKKGKRDSPLIKEQTGGIFRII